MSAVVDDVDAEVLVDVDVDDDDGTGAKVSFLAVSFAIGAPACDPAKDEDVPKNRAEIKIKPLIFFMMMLSEIREIEMGWNKGFSRLDTGPGCCFRGV